MPAVARAESAPSSLGLATRVAQLRADVCTHKAAIRRHRAALGAAKTALVDLEAQCRRLGIGLYVEEKQPWLAPR